MTDLALPEAPAPGARHGDAAAGPSRARLPDVTGRARRGDVSLAWASYGAGPVTVVLMPTWSIVPSRVWKAQVPYLARHYRVITFDGRGSGHSSRPRGAPAYADAEYAADTIAVLDDAGVDTAVLVSVSRGATWSVQVAAEHPERVAGLLAIAPACSLDGPEPEHLRLWDQRHPGPDRPDYNRHTWLEGGYDDFLHTFFARLFSEAHSTKAIEDGIAWGRDVGPETLVDTTAGHLGLDGATRTDPLPLCSRVRCPVTVLHGTEDRVRPVAGGRRLAELTGGQLVLLEGSGHGPHARDPVLVNHEIRRFLETLGPVPPEPPRRRVRGPSRPRRALYLSSPIGLGHARRDVAVAGELRRLRPDLEIDWLAQDPVTRVLERAGERVHPASRFLASESGHVEAESGEHDLHAFRAIRRMDEILVNNFMVFDELLEQEHYDLVIGDEAWDVDHFLHENPELKRSAYAWFTDFVGWLPMPDGGEEEAALTADMNAEMLEQRARFHRLRDRSIFVGNPEDVVPADFGPGLPGIREWTQQNFDFAGYVTGFDPSAHAGQGEREALRERLGWRPDERICVVTVGGSGVGEPLLRRVLDAIPLARRQTPDLRFEVVTGPRIAPGLLPRPEGARLHGYLPDLTTHLAACDVALVQGGLTTCMELTALGRPFVFVPLRHHFEQNLHVRHRLEQYRAGTCLEYEQACDPDVLAGALLKAMDRPVAYRPVETDGARRAAGLLADLL